MLVGLKSFVVSRTTGLYGLKFVKLSASAGDFLTSFHIIGRLCYNIIKIQSTSHANFTLKDHSSYKTIEAKGRKYIINKVDTTETNG
jgi:hypothetical protein